MVARYADEAKRLQQERVWLVVQALLWACMALGAVLVGAAGFAGLRGGAGSTDLFIVLLIAGLIGAFVAGTLMVASIVEFVEWSQSHRDGPGADT